METEKYKQVTVYIRPADYDMLRKLTVKQTRPLTFLVRGIIADWVKKNKQ